MTETVVLEPWTYFPPSLSPAQCDEAPLQVDGPLKARLLLPLTLSQGLWYLYRRPSHQHFSPSSCSVLQRLNSSQVWPRKKGFTLPTQAPLINTELLLQAWQAKNTGTQQPLIQRTCKVKLHVNKGKAGRLKAIIPHSICL